MLTDDQIRERLKMLGCSEKTIEDEVRRYNEYKRRQASPKSEAPKKTERPPVSRVKRALDDALKGGA